MYKYILIYSKHSVSCLTEFFDAREYAGSEVDSEEEEEEEEEGEGR